MTDAAVEPAPRPRVRTGVHVVEVGPRDGLQNEATVLDVDTRVELVRRLVAAGVRRLETVSFVNPARVPQMAGAEEVMAAVPRTAPDGSHVDHIGLVLNERGLDRALAAGVDEVNLVAITTETFSRAQPGRRRRGRARRHGADARAVPAGRGARVGHGVRGVRLPVRGRGDAPSR